MKKQIFIHRISKGSKFSQIYIPYEFKNEFEPGDLVEIKLLEKNVKIYYSKNQKKLTEFKKKLIEGIFKILVGYKEIKQIFIFGSFLTKKIDYKDIDILILTNEAEKKKDFENIVYNNLINIFNMKLHPIFFDEKKLQKLLKVCPLTRNMLYHYVSNQKFKIPKETKINYNHIKFLLMMPEDLLGVSLDYGEEYYNALRTLYAIENFLIGREIYPNKIDVLIENSIGKRKLNLLKRNETLGQEFLMEIKSIIKNKLEKIYNEINYGEK